MCTLDLIGLVLTGRPPGKTPFPVLMYETRGQLQTLPRVEGIFLLVIVNILITEC